jgi:hypothetical protein
VATTLLGRFNRIYGVPNRPDALPPPAYRGNVGFFLD